jgi:DNA repair photolyase
VLVAPLMPGINDSPEQVAQIVELATEAGAAFVTGVALHLRGEVRDLFFEWLREQRPDLVGRYDRLYERGAYMPAAERERLAALARGVELEPGQRMRGRALPRQPSAGGRARSSEPAQTRLF